MFKITLKIDGMMCGMCEAHINDEIRKSFQVTKVSSSHTKGKTVIIAETDIPDTDLEAVIVKTGYQMLSVDHASYEKRGLLDKILKKK